MSIISILLITAAILTTIISITVTIQGKRLDKIGKEEENLLY